MGKSSSPQIIEQVFHLVFLLLYESQNWRISTEVSFSHVVHKVNIALLYLYSGLCKA